MPWAGRLARSQSVRSSTFLSATPSLAFMHKSRHEPFMVVLPSCRSVDGRSIDQGRSLCPRFHGDRSRRTRDRHWWRTRWRRCHRSHRRRLSRRHRDRGDRRLSGAPGTLRLRRPDSPVVQTPGQRERGKPPSDHEQPRSEHPRHERQHRCQWHCGARLGDAAATHSAYSTASTPVPNSGGQVAGSVGTPIMNLSMLILLQSQGRANRLGAASTSSIRNRNTLRCQTLG